MVRTRPVFAQTVTYNKPNKLENHKKHPIYYVSLIILTLQFYSWNFNILNYEIFIKEFQVL